MPKVLISDKLSPAAVAGLEGRGWHFYRFVGDHGYRLMCSWATREETIDAFLADARPLLTPTGSAKAPIG